MPTGSIMSTMGMNSLSGFGWTRILWTGTILPPTPSTNFTAASTMVVPVVIPPGTLSKHYAVPDHTMKELYRATLSKRLTLLRAGYTVIKLWECEWDCLVDTDEALQRFMHSFDLVPPLEPHDAFFWGPHRCCGLACCG